jgi:hypothetical protein
MAFSAPEPGRRFSAQILVQLIVIALSDMARRSARRGTGLIWMSRGFFPQKVIGWAATSTMFIVQQLCSQVSPNSQLIPGLSRFSVEESGFPHRQFTRQGWKQASPEVRRTVRLTHFADRPAKHARQPEHSWNRRAWRPVRPSAAPDESRTFRVPNAPDVRSLLAAWRRPGWRRPCG